MDLRGIFLVISRLLFSGGGALSHDHPGRPIKGMNIPRVSAMRPEKRLLLEDENWDMEYLNPITQVGR